MKNNGMKGKTSGPVRTRLRFVTGRRSGAELFSDLLTQQDGFVSLSAADLLVSTLSQPRVIQAFRPFAESLEWQLGQRYLRECGNLAFISDVAPVPYVVNNDGYLASNSAELLFFHFEQGLPSSFTAHINGAGCAQLNGCKQRAVVSAGDRRVLGVATAGGSPRRTVDERG